MSRPRRRTGTEPDRLEVDGQPVRADDAWSDLTNDLWWAATDLDATLQRVAQRASRLLDASSAVFVAEDGQLVPRAFWDDDEQRRANIRRLFDRGPAPADGGQLGQVLHGGQPVLVTMPREAEPSTHYHGYISEHRLTSYLILPLVAHGETLGLLAVGRHDDQAPITDADQATARQLAKRAAHIVRIAAIVQHLRVADTALAAMSEAVVANDMHGRITFWNDGAERIYGWSAAEVVGRPLAEVVQPGASDIRERQARVYGALVTDGRWAGRAEQVRRDGTRVTVDCVATWLRDQDGNHIGGVLVSRDVSREVAMSSQLDREQALAQAALDSSPMLTAVTDHDGVLLATSRGWAERIGHDAPVASRVSDAAVRLLPDARARIRFLDSFTAIVTDQVPRTQDDYDVSTSEGNATFTVHLTRVPDVGATITIADITDRASRERALRYSANHDPVTRLANRGVFMDRAVHAMNRAGRGQTAVGLLFCDLDAFKDLNDRYGHGVGDDVLEAFASRLVRSCRASDTVARIGGDEFVVLLEDPVDDDVVARVCRRVVGSSALAMDLPSATLTVTSSVGAVLVRPGPEGAASEADVELLLTQADAAMYEAKSQGRNRWVMFDDAIQTKQDGRLVLLEDPSLEAAEELQLHAQPQWDSAGAVAGATAFLRWQDPRLIQPSVELHRVVPGEVRDWMLSSLTRAFAAWQPSLPAGFRVGVTLSPAQWLDAATTDAVLAWVTRGDVPATSVRIGVPQEAVAVAPDHTRAVARRLAQLGVNVAVTGFGTGSAAMTDLIGLGTTAALGRRVVRDIGVVPGAERLLAGLCALCRDVGMTVLATGVETPEQLQAVRSAGCSLSQGQLLGRPVELDQFQATYLAGD